MGRVLVVPYPSQGHINPMYQLCKRLASKGVKTSLVITTFISNTFNPQPSCDVGFDIISDGHDGSGFAGAESIKCYLQDLQSAGSRTLMDVIARHNSSSSGNPVTCIIADPFLSWAVDVAKMFRIKAALFFTQSCSVNYMYYLVHQGKLRLPISSDTTSLEGATPMLQLQDVPTFLRFGGSDSGYFDMVLSQFSDVERADFILVNTFLMLESKEVGAMSKLVPILTIGPLIPSMYLDQSVECDTHYGLDLFITRNFYSKWLSAKPEASVVYVSFGSMARLDVKQMEELSWGLHHSGFHFFWVVQDSEQSKLPAGFIEKAKDKGMVVNWSDQLQLLSNKSVGCFITHCGWNSTIEALSLGVPVVAMPQWTDQPTNAGYLERVWKVGIRTKVDEKSGIATRDEIVRCLDEVMLGDGGREMRKKAREWRELAIKAVSEGGTSATDMAAFISQIPK